MCAALHVGKLPPAIATLREALGKAANGQIEISLQQAGNEVRIEVRGAGVKAGRL